jgi:hypothetical protein
VLEEETMPTKYQIAVFPIADSNRVSIAAVNNETNEIFEHPLYCEIEQDYADDMLVDLCATGVTDEEIETKWVPMI